MSSEITKTGSRAAPLTAKVAREGSHNRDLDSSHSGGVSEDGTTGRVGNVSWEISGCEPAGVQPLDQGRKAEAGRAAGEVGVPRSSEDPPESKSGGERRGGTWVKARQSSEGPGDGREEAVARLFDRIGTPIKVQKLQRTLYRKAKAEPSYRFYSLYGELLRPDVIDTAMVMVAHNDGVAGIDGQECSVLVDDRTREIWKSQLLEELRTKRYRPGPVLRVYIPKDDGKQRPLGIPTVKDRVVQAAVAIVMLPILEADSHPNSYAYRPKRGAHQAMKAIGKAVVEGRWEVIDADLSGYFDSIPHRTLLRIVSRRISDGMILKLVRGWLKASIVERNPKTGRRTRKDNDQGTPQGGSSRHC
jgi:RNA-directed DNA polymerase